MKFRFFSVLVLLSWFFTFAPNQIQAETLYDLEDSIADRLDQVCALPEGKKECKQLKKGADALSAYLDAPDRWDKRVLKRLSKVPKYIEKSGTSIPSIAVEGPAAVLAELESIAGQMDNEVNDLYPLLNEKGRLKLEKKHDAADVALQNFYNAKDTGILASKAAKLAIKGITKYTSAFKTGNKLIPPPPSPGEKSFTARVNGESFTGNKKFTWWLQGRGCWGSNCITIAAHEGKNLKKGNAINLEINWDPAVGGTGVFEWADISYGEFDDSTMYDFMNAHLWLGSGRVVITKDDGGKLSGTFSGTLNKINGLGPSVVTIVGEFSGLGQDPSD